MQTRMRYAVTANGTIVRAEGEISERSAQLDPVFAKPFADLDLIGQNVFSGIRGAEVLQVYALLHQRILQDGRPVLFPFRCDGPAVRREMLMSMSRDNDFIQYESVVVREVQRNRPAPVPTADAIFFIKLCSSCQRYRFPFARVWKDIDELGQEPDLPQQFRYAHTFCHGCYRHFMEKVVPDRTFVRS